MPYSNNPGTEEDPYADGAPSAPKPEENPKEDEQGEGSEGLLPLSVFPEPPKVGDVCDFEVTAVHENEVMVKYVREEEDEKKEEGYGKEPEEATMPSGDSEMSSMME